METRTIGSLEVSVVGLGCNNFGRRIDEAASRAVIDEAVERGITLFDTADIYGGPFLSEEIIGRALEGRRDRVVLATKFGMSRGKLTGGAAPDYVRSCIEGSLSRLRTDRIDLYQLHEPDPQTPIQDTLGVLTELVQAGKVREIGCSNFSAEQIREAAAVASGARFVCVQNELNLLNRDDVGDGLAEAERQGMAYLPYSPLADGLLTGKYHRGEQPAPGTRLDFWYDEAERAEVLTDETFGELDRLAAFAAERGHTLLELAFAWLLAHGPVSSVIAGATSPEQVRANSAAGGWRLSADDLSALEA